MRVPCRPRWCHAVALMLLAALLAACGADDAAVPDDGAGDAAAVTVAGSEFDPGRIEVAPGTTVTWTNEDGLPHTVTAGVPDAPDDAFDEPLAGSGGTASITFDEPGTFPYFCRIHPRMTAEVVVG
jgi:plastocyanin